MRDTVSAHLKALFASHQDLAESLPDEAFAQRLSVPSNTIGAQFWCLIGTRESFARAISEGVWAGWNCSMSGEETGDKQKVVQVLKQAAQQFEDTLTSTEWTNTRDGMLLDLLEHESQHQGQLIRFVYGLKHKFPTSLAERWALEQR